MHQEHKSCGCGHEHSHKGCGCGHDHRHEHGDCGCKGNGHTKACACGHDHGTSPAQKADSTGCGCGKHHGEDDSGGGGDDASGHPHPTPAGGNAACSKQEPAGACHDEIMQQKEHCGCGHDHGHGHGHEHCGCGHDHGHGHGHEHCGCGHDHGHGHGHEHCGCGHDHGHGHGFELEHSCGCGHDHGHSHGGARFPWPAAVAVPLFVAGLLLEDMYSTAALLAAYVLAGFAPIWAAVKNAVRGNLFDENFLMTIASLGAVVIGEYPEACAVMLLYRLGEYLQNRAVDSSMRSIDALLELRPERARLLENGEEREVNADRLRPGDLIVVRPGDKVAADGVVREGGSYLDLSALTGESAPVAVAVGDTVLSGGINRDGLLTVEVTHAADASTAARVIRLVEQASREKAPTENFITKFSRWYTPAVCALAALLVVILGGFGIQSWGDAFYNACVLLVVSCPCALAISVPLGFFAGLGAASRRGVLFKGGNYLEALGEVKHFVVDKTGTLTTGKLRVETVEPAGTDKQHLLETAAAAEAFSNHPVAQAILEACPDHPEASEVKELAGRGISCMVEGRSVLCGNARLLKENGIEVPDESATCVHVARDGDYLGHITVRDELRDDAVQTLRRLRELGVETVTMLTGDNARAAAPVAQAAGVDRVFASLLPQDKVSRLADIKREAKKGAKTAFVGDGINDAPVLAMADVGISMGMGTAAAIEASDVVLTEERLGGLTSAMEISIATRRTVRENIVFSLGVKLAVMAFAAVGHATMWAAVFADVGVAMLAILNSARLLRKR